jgi:hypothetical protein
VCVIIVVLLCIGAGAWWLRRRRAAGRPKMFEANALQDRTPRPASNDKLIEPEQPARALRYLDQSEVPSARTNGPIGSRGRAA